MPPAHHSPSSIPRLLAVLLLALALFLETPTPTMANEHLHPWSELVTQAMVGHTLRNGAEPSKPLNPLANLLVGGRILSILHLAQWQALNEVLVTRNVSSLTAAKEQLRALMPCLQAASAGAGKHTLETLLPAGDAQVGLPALYAAQSGDDNNADVVSAREIGVKVGKAVLSSRSNDGAATVLPPYLGANSTADAGKWRPTPPLFLPGGAEQWSTAAYKQAYYEVKSVGNATSKERLLKDTEGAVFWCEQPDAIIFAIVGRVTEKMDVLEASRVYAMAAVAGLDARVASMDSKYFYSTWRPVTALPLGNGGILTAVPDFTPLLATPPTPEFPSAHAVHGEAIMEVLRQARGGGKGDEGAEKAADQLDVNLTTPTVRGLEAGKRSLQATTAAPTAAEAADVIPVVTRQYSSLTAVSEDLAYSRIYGGIHYRFTADKSLKLGTSVGQRVVDAFDAKFTKVGMMGKEQQKEESKKGEEGGEGGARRGLRTGKVSV
ncbi:phosphoesterase pa-phosphatase related protein [Nannochloropsis oceanica]